MANNDNDKNIEISAQIGYMVEEALYKVGIPANLNGHGYLSTAISLCIADPSYINQITSRLYPDVAKKHGTTRHCVDHSMRCAIESAFRNRGFNVINEFIGETLNPNKSRPTNSEFIAQLAQKIRLESMRPAEIAH